MVARRFSKQRQIIYDSIVKNPVHPTADMVYQALKDEYPKLSLGTVYRNLNLLADMGLLLKFNVNSVSERFDGRTDEHYHMECQCCNKIFDIPTPFQTNLLDEVQKNTKHQLNEHQLFFSGVCENCNS